MCTSNELSEHAFTLLSHPDTLLRIKRLHLCLNFHVLLVHRRPKATVLASVWISRPWTVRDRFATIRSPHVDWLRVLASPGVNANIDCSVKTISNSLANQADLHDWVVPTLFAHVEESILGIKGLRLLVGVVGRCFFDLTEEVLLNVHLTNVRDCAALNGIIGEELGTVVNDGFR
jgi:hypothetical protein